MTARKLVNDLDFNGRLPINLGAPVNDDDGVAKIYVDTEVATAKSRANHSGTQLANTISDFDTAVRTNKLNQLATPDGPVSMGGFKITDLADPSAATDAATMGWVTGQVAGLASGQYLKGTVKVAVAANVNLAAPGASLDGVAMANGDVALLTAQTTGTQNGPYVFNGAAAAMTRATNWDAAGEAQVGSYWIVNQGTQADKFAMMTNDTFTLGTDTATFTFVGTAAAGVLAVEANIGNGAATSFTVTHNFGTRAVIVAVYRNSSPWDDVDVYVRRPDLNSVVIEPDLVFSANEYHVVVTKA